MSARGRSESRFPWREGGVLVCVLLVGGILWWALADDADEERVEIAAVCVECGYEGTTPVGETPTLEEWPRECPHCHKKSLYMSENCRHCGKPIPRNEPIGGRLGFPEKCPHCQYISRGT